MDREGAEMYLRRLGEAELREALTPEFRQPLTPAAWQPWSGGLGSTARMIAVAMALTAVGALDAEIAEGILGDFQLAVDVRQPQRAQETPRAPGVPGVPGMPGMPGIGGTRSGPTSRPRAIRFAGGGMLMRGVLQAWPARSTPGGGTGAGPGGGTGAGPGGGTEAGPGGGAHAGAGGAGDAAGGERVVAVGVTVPFDRGELYLISYAHTGSGARFTVVWRIRDAGRALPGLGGMPPVERFSATDDRGGRYRLQFAGQGEPNWTGKLSLHPEPPRDIRWIDICAPGGETRVSLDSVDPSPGVAAEVREVTVSPGEHLLNQLAVRLLTIAPEFPHDLRLQLAAVSPGPLSNAAAGLGDVIAALEAADALSPLSPLPGRLAALCASLRVSGHGITAPPARDLPEPWLSMLAYYHRRKRHTEPERDGFAPLAVGLPELDGIRLTLLGLDNSGGNTVLSALASGPAPDTRRGSAGVDMHFPLSVWVRDSGGRWHAARTSGWRWADGEYAITLHMVPPLDRSTTRIEVLAAGQSAEVRVRLPLDWGNSP